MYPYQTGQPTTPPSFQAAKPSEAIAGGEPGGFVAPCHRHGMVRKYGRGIRPVLHCPHCWGVFGGVVGGYKVLTAYLVTSAYKRADLVSLPII